MIKREWDTFLAPHKSGVLPLMREFYASLEELEQFGMVKVKGKLVRCNTKEINDFYGLPEIPRE